MEAFRAAWNEDAALVEAAAEADFSAVIGYGFEDDMRPRGVLGISAGQAVSAGAWSGESLDLDLRATPDTWQKWLGRPLDPLAVGAALASRQIANRRGDLGAFTAEPAKARVLARSFAVLAAIDGGAFTLPEAED